VEFLADGSRPEPAGPQFRMAVMSLAASLLNLPFGLRLQPTIGTILTVLKSQSHNPKAHGIS
jgi:hypothetical protein